jgi:hypothetical protein
MDDNEEEHLRQEIRRLEAKVDHLQKRKGTWIMVALILFVLVFADFAP